MRIQIKGSPITSGDVKQALDDILKKLGFHEEKHLLKGVNLYFNVYDRDAGESVTFFNADDDEIGGYVWMTPDELEKHRARVEKKRAAEERARERERARFENRIRATREKVREDNRAKREAKKAAEKAAKESSS